MQLTYKKLKQRSITYSSFAIIILLTSSCKKWVEIDSPKNQILTDAVFSDNSTATSAQFGVYYGLFNNIILPLSKGTGLSSDELTNYSINTDAIALYTNALSIASRGTDLFWNNSYNSLYQENAILEAIPKSSISTAFKTQLEGEAKFTRALIHFYLSNLFGDIPIATSTDYTLNAHSFRAPKTEVYKQIIQDLTDAQNLLNTDYLDANLNVTVERVRPTKAAATALLARVYLYLGDLTKDNENYRKAEELSTTVIQNPTFSLALDLNAIFIKNSKEAIWQIMPTGAGFNTQEGKDFILLGAPQSGSVDNTAISPQLFKAFEIGDQRQINWINALTTKTLPVASYTFAYKYKIKNVAALSEYEMILRLAEQYLIRAEARVQLGEANATDDLNAIRHRAGLGDYTGASDKSSLLNAILHERRIEFFAEMGHRWLDLKRTGKVDEVMKVITPQKGGGSWNTNQQLYPIPQADRNINPNLSQNSGYN